MSLGAVVLKVRLNKDIRPDEKAESILKPFILIVVMVFCMGFVLTGVSRMGLSAEGINNPQITNPYFDSNWTLISPLSGYDVDDGDEINEICKPEHEDPFIFTDDEDDDDKYVHIVRDNVRYVEGSTDIWSKYEDFIAVRRNTVEPGSVRGDWYNAAIPLSAFADWHNWDNVTNVTHVEFKLGKSTDCIFLCTTNSTGYDIEAGVWSNEYEIYYGWSNWRVEEVELSEAIAMAMWADIPGTNDYVDYLVHGVFAATMIFVAFTMITRIIPFLGD